MIEATLALGAALIEASSGNIGIYRGILIAYLILRKSPKRTATGSSTASNISRIPIRHAGSTACQFREDLNLQRNPYSVLDPQKKPQENSYKIFYSLKYIPYTHSTCRIYSLPVPGRFESTEESL